MKRGKPNTEKTGSPSFADSQHHTTTVNRAAFKLSRNFIKIITKVLRFLRILSFVRK